MIKKYIKKEYILCIFLFIAIFSTIIIKPLGDLDEIWNYNVARNMTIGKIPYKEISTITTPLLPAINSIFLKVLGNNLIIMRILSAILGTAILYTIYKIFRKVLKETNISVIFTLLIGILLKDVYCIDYNYATLLLTLIILYLDLKKQSITKTHEFIQGILAGLAICTKQSIGIIVAVATILYLVINIKSKQDIKSELKNIGIRTLGVILPLFVLLIYLIVTNALGEFINYAILGISTFDNSIKYTELFNNESLIIVILAKIVPIITLTTVIVSVTTFITQRIKKEKIDEQTRTIQILTLYGLPMLAVIYPIADKIHFLIGSIIILILTIYLIIIGIELIYNKIEFKKKKFVYKTVTLLIMIILAILIVEHTVSNILYYIDKYTENKINTKIECYNYIEIPDYLIERINDIDTYITEQQNNGKSVYILDAESAIYTIPLNKYTKDYDMFLKGNIGKDGEKGQIEKIEKEANEKTIYLIKNEKYSLNWQTPKTVIDYIRLNFQKTGELTIFDIYEYK